MLPPFQPMVSATGSVAAFVAESMLVGVARVVPVL